MAETPIRVQERPHGRSMYGLRTSVAYPVKTLVAIALLPRQARRAGPLASA